MKETVELIIKFKVALQGHLINFKGLRDRFIKNFNNDNSESFFFD
jgi:hypothetical protein